MAIASKSYVLTLDGRAVEQDGKQTGVILVGAGGTIDDAVAKKYGVAVEKPADADSAPLAGAASGTVADSAAVAGALKDVAAVKDGTNENGKQNP